LATGNHIRIGAVEIVVHVTPARMMPSEFAATPMDDRELEIARQTSELDKVRQEMASLRQQLYDHYQDRRDQLAAMHDDLEKAKRALDEREKKVRLLEDDAGDRRQRDRQRQEAVEREAAELNERTIRLEAKLRKLDDEESHRQLEWSRKHADLQERERALAEQTQTLDARIKRYEADVLRLTRIETNLEERESELKRQAEEINSCNSRNGASSTLTKQPDSPSRKKRTTISTASLPIAARRWKGNRRRSPSCAAGSNACARNCACANSSSTSRAPARKPRKPS
jgi:DNA repair exonuclease SbcCD ATPase subunit